MAKQDLFVPGAEFSKLEFENFWDWFVQVNDVALCWKYQPTYILAQFAFIFGGIATLIHALIRGGRLPYLWLGTVLHGIVVESLCYAIPDVDNFWHSQTPIIFLGRRLPLHILMLYPCFIYNASVAVAKMKLPKWSEPFAVGLGSVLIDIPYDIVSVNFLHWTWHDTDPSVEDRHYWVPWNSYYFHMTFAASFTFWFHFFRRKLCKNGEKWQADTLLKELLCTVLAALLGAPGGIALFVPIYHPLHDIYKIHSEVTYFIFFAIFLLIIWTGDRTVRARERHTKTKVHWSTWILISHLVLHYSNFLATALFFKPENEIAIGLKEPVGPCDEYVDVHTPFGMVLKKRKYLCVSDYDEKYFSWDCLPGRKPPSEGAIWYTACGVPLPNRVEYVAIVSILCVVAATVFVNLHFLSYGDDVLKSNSREKTKKH